MMNAARWSMRAVSGAGGFKHAATRALTIATGAFAAVFAFAAQAAAQGCAL
jgi:hypothetical protein